MIGKRFSPPGNGLAVAANSAARLFRPKSYRQRTKVLPAPAASRKSAVMTGGEGLGVGTLRPLRGQSGLLHDRMEPGREQTQRIDGHSPGSPGREYRPRFIATAGTCR